MGKRLALLSFFVCWPALASFVPFATFAESQPATPDDSGWLVGQVGSLGVSSHPDNTLTPLNSVARWLTDLDEFGPQHSLEAADSIDGPAVMPDGTRPPTKLAFLVIILVGGVIRFLTSATFLDFLTDLYSPLAPY